MDYVVDIYDERGEGISSEEFSHFESTIPIPIPNVGDCIYVPSGCGPDSKQTKDVKVLERQFTYTPEGQNSDACVRVELFCREN